LDAGPLYGALIAVSPGRVGAGDLSLDREHKYKPSFGAEASRGGARHGGPCAAAIRNFQAPGKLT
jgi:hypothetical protein